MKKKALVLKSFKDEKKNKIKRNIKMFLLFRKKHKKTIMSNKKVAKKNYLLILEIANEKTNQTKNQLFCFLLLFHLSLKKQTNSISTHLHHKKAHSETFSNH